MTLPPKPSTLIDLLLAGQLGGGRDGPSGVLGPMTGGGSRPLASSGPAALSGPAGLFGNAARALGSPVTALAQLAPQSVPQPRRRVFFSFHYQNDINRVNIVRKSVLFRPGNGAAGFFDHSIWETAKRTSDVALKRLIHREMFGSTVTCVLAGSETFRRQWVRYEIAHSLRVQNGLLTVAIDGLRSMNQGAGAQGPDPLAYIALSPWGEDKGLIYEFVEGGWRRFALLSQAVPWPRWLPKAAAGYLIPLSHGSARYDYVEHDGFNNLAGWTRDAARKSRVGLR